MNKIILIVLSIVCSLYIMACSLTSDESNQAAIDLSQYQDQRSFCSEVTLEKVQSCAAKNGSLQKQGKAQCYACTITYSDAGKSCSGLMDCQGDCYNYGEPVPVNEANQVGQCAKNNITFGCHQKIENGIAAGGMLCID